MRYEVWTWNVDDIKGYEDAYYPNKFEEDLEKAGHCYYTLTQYGNLAGESESEDEAMTMAMRAEDDLGMYGMVFIYDRVEKIFFN